MGIFDLEKQFAFYGAYLNNPVNILIHMVFVWPMFFTGLIFFDFMPPLFNLSLIQPYEHSSLVLNFGFLFALIYALLYVALDKKAGSLAALLCLFVGFLAVWLLVNWASLSPGRLPLCVVKPVHSEYFEEKYILGVVNNTLILLIFNSMKRWNPSDVISQR